MTTPVVLSFGMGVDSTAILLRWLEEPPSRDFDLSDLIVITAMTGDEYEETRGLVERHVLPRLREHDVRFVQVARGGPSTADGVVVLSDSRSPERVHLEGVWRLSDELSSTGTVPQVAQGKRLCSLKFKGWPLDTWLAGELGERPFRHVMGFNAEEQRRADRDASYSTEKRASEYPLIEWGWGREKCEDYIAGVVGERWAKSCCVYCPFATDRHESRHRACPDAGADAMMLELTALALNPRSTLFANRSVIANHYRRVPSAAALFEERLAEAPWSVYEVRRVFHSKRVAWRSVRTLLTGSFARCEALLLQRALATGASGPDTDEHGVLRLGLAERNVDAYPTIEHHLVVAPMGVADKQRNGFEDWWARLTEPAAA